MKVKPRPAAGPRLYKGARGPVPSVTEVLGVIPKPHFDFWREKNGSKKKLEDAATLGTAIHAIAAGQCRGEGKVAPPELKPFRAAIRDFLFMHVGECIEVERALVSDHHGFGGTLDLYCRMNDGSYAVIDWKTTSSLTREHGLQLAAYAVLCREHGLKVNRRIAVRIKKDSPGRYYARTYADHRGDVEAFLALKTYWHWANKSKLEKAA